MGQPVVVRGVGLHTGEPVVVRLHPAEGPVRFWVSGVELRPLASAVVETARCTALGRGSLRLLTVEHLLAALYIRGIWEGLVVEVSGPEIPILDGSAQEWLEALQGFPSRGPQPVSLSGSIRVEEGHSRVLAQPSEVFSVSATILFPHPKIGYQQVVSPPVALEELARARTFGFLEEVEALRARGLIRGASLENALVFNQYGYVNTPRMLFEPVYHKALDLLGDLYLAGRPYRGRFIAHRGSHRLHVELARLLQDLG
ncbi:MAG: UDP-3-O-acyl-N-acetylglucosamine deacetylase [Meiothermus sp.]|uniref:UDP-3-O-acyl-N-acetylglucosamine deacetylase n=1 Tax=Meiothermus sp. TaxID=1955249 RepID=UPI0025DFDC18|nr:UDP-3-O-acyl-N-acetylglucosamine deacetylase [Meiothermus sp.]MCS7057889.1 UDP-3-O-acyl-N-acetylglucosamine deacetylase [Meiothermus sp.]MCS7194235.1 UDP-3-O-acyl-N-acetylglucosamine deacetylase [Meiothermus sp.]MCX7740475.1 UDP-3-O-acyl-N-acetylglucosamine deacetylase [Meiothermus sp.]MDW8090096.1 UDP-3-O-acyl-N-acetylglucosamine deacetylase [Meiothermus sp.]MDW8480746.1 UDP-3-O-acyl-N-acetylglucosamine deacetylase [Meiothermus sp.]